MGIVFRFPFFLLGIFLWTMVGGIISFINLLTLPIFGLATAIFPSIFNTSVKDVLTFGILRRGYRNLFFFLNG